MTTTPSPTVLDVIRTSPAGALVDTPVSDVISGLGLPQLPQLPAITLPDLSGFQMPTLPTIDPTTLIQPAISLLSSMGSGAASMGTELVSIFSSVSKALTSAASTSSAATATVSNSWQGDSANAAQVKSNEVETVIPTVDAQGQQLKVILLNAEATVAEGYAELSALIARFTAEVMAGIAFLVTPAGLPYLITMATDALSEAGVITAKTRGQLTVHTAEVTAAGLKIPVPGAPNAADVASLANQVTQAVQPFLSVGSTAVQKVVEKGSEVVSAGSTAASSISSAGQSVVSALTTNTSKDTTTTNKDTTTTNKDTTTTDGKPVDTTTLKTDDTTSGGGIPGGMPMGSGLNSSPLSPYSGKMPSGEGLGSGSPVSRVSSNNNETQTRSTTSMPGGMGSGAGLANKGETESSGERTALVTGAHGDEVVGVIEGVSIPVVGAVEPVDEPPDKALTL
ncbi:hypothetical protein GFY24_14530 [Nocardia sp. SYP-A9097]|uniref:hypothetical protein n=1 Tax=Nocardia sp. SYP-A9097 TaxID=2663237 RepID=UPI00129AAC32|nr:hypothetical protein [Nocardia sp. SYP-A9097]MRH88645.1 hypothetical protein [Nocardia sp. SYP-A9097]